MIIRAAIPDDAEELIAYVQRLDEEPDSMLPRAPGEFQITVEQERQILAEYAAADNSAYFVAEVEGRIVGALNCNGGKRLSSRHCGTLGISVAESHRDRGIGTALMNHVLEWARGTGILRKLELEVLAHNERAIYVYGKFGFEEEGLRRNSVFLRGRYIDVMLMGRMV